MATTSTSAYNTYATQVGTASLGWSTNVPYQEAMQMQRVYTTYPPIIPNRTVKFNRLNTLVEVAEGSNLTEPLDALRLQVFKWLGR